GGRVGRQGRVDGVGALDADVDRVGGLEGRLVGVPLGEVLTDRVGELDAVAAGLDALDAVVATGVGEVAGDLAAGRGVEDGAGALERHAADADDVALDDAAAGEGHLAEAGAGGDHVGGAQRGLVVVVLERVAAGPEEGLVAATVDADR